MTFIGLLRQELSDSAVLTSPEYDFAPHFSDLIMTSPPGADPIGVAFPGSTEEVSKIFRLAQEHGVTIVPQGGLTGMAGGALPIGPSLLLSLKKMNAIEEIDPDSMTVTVQAGTILQNVHEACEAQGLMFPLDFGGRGSAQIGGVISTNAGGNRVLRYGMTRDLVLGLEVVLPDGSVLNMLHKMLKNNTGYDLRQLFIGAEGTLGIVTRATLKLVPLVQPALTALCALEDYDAALAFLRMAREDLGSDLTSFEAMWPNYFAVGTKGAGRPSPFAEEAGIYVLIETMNRSGNVEGGQALLEKACEEGLLLDAVAAASLRDVQKLWEIRESTDVMTRMYGEMAHFDASIPTGEIGKFLAEFEHRLLGKFPDAVYAVFGHIADGNLHMAVQIDDEVPELEVEDMTYELIGEWGGAVSGEHGIGIHKVPYLQYSRGKDELALMRTIKNAIDPNNILNPGKVVPEIQALD